MSRVGQQQQQEEQQSLQQLAYVSKLSQKQVQAIKQGPLLVLNAIQQQQAAGRVNEGQHTACKCRPAGGQLPLQRHGMHGWSFGGLAWQLTAAEQHVWVFCQCIC
jgi:hypothetical protein